MVKTQPKTCHLKTLLTFLPSQLSQAIEKMPPHRRNKVQEIRLRLKGPVSLVSSAENRWLSEGGGVTENLKEALLLSREVFGDTVERITRSSLYAFSEEIKEGYLTLPGGHRVGFCGKVVMEGGQKRAMRDFSSLNIRVARDIRGVAKPVFPYLLAERRPRLFNTLIFSPPGAGKTTLLRDLIRRVSYGDHSLGFSGAQVGVVDERGELGATYEGVPQNDLGPRADVLTGVPKGEGMMMLLRSMGPQVLATDEIGSSDDVEALKMALNSGVRVLATAHGRSPAQLRRRPALGRLLSHDFFGRFVSLGFDCGRGTVTGVYDHQDRLLYSETEEDKRC